MSEPDPDTARLDALFLAIFEDDRRGAEVFEQLLKRFGATKVHTDGGIDAVLKTYRAAAHRELLDYIVLRCNRARGLEPPTGED
jgi:hypothetical protein